MPKFKLAITRLFTGLLALSLVAVFPLQAIADGGTSTAVVCPEVSNCRVG